MAERDERGFTLVELLIVIVVLGVLATITVFAVRGITDQGQENACVTEFNNLEKAQALHWSLTGVYGDEAALVAGGALTSESTLFTVTAAGAGATYDITPDGTTCTQTGSGGTPAGPASPPVVTMPTSSYSWHGGVAAYRYPGDPGGTPPDEILVLGRLGARADWVAADDAGVTTSRRTNFVDMDTINAGQVDTLLNAVDNSGITTVIVYTDDDTGTLAGSGGSVTAYVQAAAPGYSDITVVTATYGDGQLANLLATLPSPNN